MSGGGRCSLFGFFGWFVQALLCLGSGLPLLYKWWHEKPRRTFLTFIVDSSKQVSGNVGIHFINLALSSALARHVHEIDSCGDDECLWYFLTFTLDCVLGLPLNYLLLTIVLKNVADRYHWKPLQGFGNYGTDKFSVTRFVSQTIAWLVIVCIGKAFICLLILAQPQGMLQASATVLALVRWVAYARHEA